MYAIRIRIHQKCRIIAIFVKFEGMKNPGGNSIHRQKHKMDSKMLKFADNEQTWNTLVCHSDSDGFPVIGSLVICCGTMISSTLGLCKR